MCTTPKGYYFYSFLFIIIIFNTKSVESEMSWDSQHFDIVLDIRVSVKKNIEMFSTL